MCKICLIDGKCQNFTKLIRKRGPEITRKIMLT